MEPLKQITSLDVILLCKLAENTKMRQLKTGTIGT
jgi:hypothetical protein